MADTPIVLADPRMVTAVGLNALETAANVRARTTRAGSQSMLNRRYEAYTIASLPDEVLPALPGNFPARAQRTAREMRLLRLLALAFKGQLKPTAGSLPPLYLSLPEHETQILLSGNAFLNDLQQVCPGVFDRAQSRADWRGRAGGLLAVSEAVKTVEQGKAALVLAGGVDTFLDTWVLSTLDKDQRVKTEVAPDSFVPGEGVGLVCVTRADRGATAGITPLACVSSVGEGFEPGHWQSKEPYKGDGLAGALEKLLSVHPTNKPFAEIFSTMNGESYWGKEWGVARLRHQTAFVPQAILQHPAEFFGDLGAAFGPVLVGLAVMGLQRQPGSGPMLVYASSDSGTRTALALSIFKS